jgi:hypothetical protein
MGIQSIDSVGKNFAAGLLGSPRIRLRTLLHFAASRNRHFEGLGGAGNHLSEHVAAFDLTHAGQK